MIKEGNKGHWAVLRANVLSEYLFSVIRQPRTGETDLRAFGRLSWSICTIQSTLFYGV